MPGCDSTLRWNSVGTKTQPGRVESSGVLSSSSSSSLISISPSVLLYRLLPLPVSPPLLHPCPTLLILLITLPPPSSSEDWSTHSPMQALLVGFRLLSTCNGRPTVALVSRRLLQLSSHWDVPSPFSREQPASCPPPPGGSFLSGISCLAAAAPGASLLCVFVSPPSPSCFPHFHLPSALSSECNDTLDRVRISSGY